MSEQTIQSLIVNLNDAKLSATSRDWIDWALILTQRLRAAGFDTSADAMRETTNVDEMRAAAAKAATVVYLASISDIEPVFHDH